MNPDQVALIQGSWARVAPIREAAAELFYNKLFELDPAVKPMFKGDMKEQGRKLMSMLSSVIGGLTRLEAMMPAIQDLGRRHAAYGVEDAHYATVGAALLWTLEQGLGEGFTPEVRQAWATAYGVLTRTMTDAAATAGA